MAHNEAIEVEDADLEEPEQFLQERGIVPDNGVYTARQLARELTRRGWRWRRDAGTVRATKAYTTTGTVSHNIVSHDPDQVTALVQVLRGAIRFDEAHGLTLTGSVRADIVVRASDHRVVAVVEVRSVRSFSDQIAAQLRGNLVSYSRDYSLVPFFLLVTQDVGYLWDQRAGVLPFSPASLTFPVSGVFAHYLPWLGAEEQAGGAELELAIAEWLRSLARRDPHRPVAFEQALVETEFLDAIQGAEIETSARV